MEFKKILIAVDSAPLALRVAETGLSLGQSIGAESALVHVINPIEAVGEPDAGILPQQEVEKLVRQGEELLQQVIDLYGRSSNPSHFICRGKPADEILKMVRDYTADLLVVGTHGKKGITRLLLPSVAESIIRRCPCPTLVVHDENL